MALSEVAPGVNEPPPMLEVQVAEVADPARVPVRDIGEFTQTPEGPEAVTSAWSSMVMVLFKVVVPHSLVAEKENGKTPFVL